MKSFLRLSLLAFLVTSFAAVSRANWYNHPVCTNAGVILSWHSTYSDFNGTDFKSPDAPGGSVIPAANLRGITERAPVLSGHKRGGSFPVWNGPSRTVIRGWINVLVQYASNDTTILSYTSNYTAGSGANQYPTKKW